MAESPVAVFQVFVVRPQPSDAIAEQFRSWSTTSTGSASACGAYNTRALGVYRKLGFVDEGRQRQLVFHAGRFHDEILMSLLRSEWSPSDH